jgi:tetratricopeptide (TPR) repeat protein
MKSGANIIKNSTTCKMLICSLAAAAIILVAFHQRLSFYSLFFKQPQTLIDKYIQNTVKTYDNAFSAIITSFDANPPKKALALEQFITTLPEDRIYDTLRSMALYHLAQTYVVLEKKTKAQTAFQTLIGFDSRRTARFKKAFHLAYGTFLVRNSNRVAAVAQFRHALFYDPNFFSALKALIPVLHSDGAYQEIAHLYDAYLNGFQDEPYKISCLFKNNQIRFESHFFHITNRTKTLHRGASVFKFPLKNVVKVTISTRPAHNFRLEDLILTFNTQKSSHPSKTNRIQSFRFFSEQPLPVLLQSNTEYTFNFLTAIPAKTSIGEMVLEYRAKKYFDSDTLILVKTAYRNLLDFSRVEQIESLLQTGDYP